MITTEKIQLTSTEFFKILLYTSFKKRWWLFILIWLIGLYSLCKENRDSFDIFFIFFAIFYPIALVIQYWRFANSKDNKLFLLERYYNIFEDKIVGILSDGTESPIKLEHFIKVIQMKRFFCFTLLRINLFIYPKIL
jgi:hypothetical protein